MRPLENACLNHISKIVLEGRPMEESKEAWVFQLKPFFDRQPPEATFEGIEEDLNALIREAINSKDSYDYIQMKAAHFGKVVNSWVARIDESSKAAQAAKKAVEAGKLCSECWGETWVKEHALDPRTVRPCSVCQSEPYARWKGDGGLKPHYTKDAIPRQDELTGPEADRYSAPEKSNHQREDAVSHERAMQWFAAIQNPEYYPGLTPENLGVGENESFNEN